MDTQTTPSKPPAQGQPRPRPQLPSLELILLNLGLYLGSLLIISAAALLLTSTASTPVQLLLLSLLTVLFYGIGLSTYLWVPKLRLASYSFVSTALALIPLCGVAIHYQGYWPFDPSYLWLLVSLLGTLAAGLALTYMQAKVMSYLALAFLVSDILAISSSLTLGLIWYFLLLVLSATGLKLLLASSKKFLPPAPLQGLLQASTFFVPGTVLAALFTQALSHQEVSLIAFLSCFYALVFYDQKPLWAYYLQVRLYSFLGLLYLSFFLAERLDYSFYSWAPSAIGLSLAAILIKLLPSRLIPWSASYDAWSSWALAQPFFLFAFLSMEDSVDITPALFLYESQPFSLEQSTLGLLWFFELAAFLVLLIRHLKRSYLPLAALGFSWLAFFFLPPLLLTFTCLALALICLFSPAQGSKMGLALETESWPAGLSLGLTGLSLLLVQQLPEEHYRFPFFLLTLCCLLILLAPLLLAALAASGRPLALEHKFPSAHLPQLIVTLILVGLYNLTPAYLGFAQWIDTVFQFDAFIYLSDALLLALACLSVLLFRPAVGRDFLAVFFSLLGLLLLKSLIFIPTDYLPFSSGLFLLLVLAPFPLYTPLARRQVTLLSRLLLLALAIRYLATSEQPLSYRFFLPLLALTLLGFFSLWIYRRSGGQASHEGYLAQIQGWLALPFAYLILFGSDFQALSDESSQDQQTWIWLSYAAALLLGLFCLALAFSYRSRSSDLLLGSLLASSLLVLGLTLLMEQARLETDLALALCCLLLLLAAKLLSRFLAQQISPQPRGPQAADLLGRWGYRHNRFIVLPALVLSYLLAFIPFFFSERESVWLLLGLALTAFTALQVAPAGRFLTLLIGLNAIFLRFMIEANNNFLPLYLLEALSISFALSALVGSVSIIQSQSADASSPRLGLQLRAQAPERVKAYFWVAFSLETGVVLLFMAISWLLWPLTLGTLTLCFASGLLLILAAFSLRQKVPLILAALLFSIKFLHLLGGLSVWFLFLLGFLLIGLVVWRLLHKPNSSAGPAGQAPAPQAPMPQPPYRQAPYQQAPAPQVPYQQAPAPQAPMPQPPYQQAPYQQPAPPANPPVAPPAAPLAGNYQRPPQPPYPGPQRPQSPQA